MKAIVLAGGFGTRLKKVLPDLPKPMAPIGERPFIEFILDQLIEGGVSEIILSVGYKAETISEYFGSSYRNVPVSYAVETEPLGTGGAILHAIKEMGVNEPVLVINGDTIINIDFSELVAWYKQAPAITAMVLKQVTDVSRYGAVQTKHEKVVGFLEKGQVGEGLINAGVYIVSPNVFEEFELSGQFSFETDFLQKFCLAIKPKPFVTDAYFIDIGIPEDYETAQQSLPQLFSR